MSEQLIAYAQQIQTSLDETAIQGLTSGWMDVKNDDIKYTGGKEVKIPIVGLCGLGDYDRQKGYPEAAVTLEWQTVTMTQDRGTKISIDAMDQDETAGILEISKLMGKFQKTKVIPEIDAYRYSTIAQHCILQNRITSGYTPDASTLLSKLYADIAEVRDVVGDDVTLIITMSMKVAMLFDLSKELGKKLETTEFSNGDVKMKVKSLDGETPIIRVSSDRMKTKYTFYDGRTQSDGSSPDQTKGGFHPTDDAKDINWLITAVDAPLGINKQDVVRIFDPFTNQKANAWASDYRRYHDLWIKQESVKGIWANTK